MGVKKEIRKEFELQLHEQYAINNNTHLSNVITLLVALIAVFSCFGYIFLNSSISFSRDFDFIESGRYTLDAFLFTAIASNVVLYIMTRICIYQGFSGRYEQFVTYALRRKNKMFQPPYTYQNANENIIFPDKYMPFGKKGLDIPQGLFGEFIKIFIGLTFLIQCSVFMKLSFNICKCDFGVSEIGIVSIIIYLLTFHLMLVNINKYWSEKAQIIEILFKSF